MFHTRTRRKKLRTEAKEEEEENRSRNFDISSCTMYTSFYNPCTLIFSRKKNEIN